MRLRNIFWKKKVPYDRITKEDYLRNFGITKNGEVYEVKDREKLYKAYEKAWECRNYEIDKFWSRSSFFLIFITMSFTGLYFLLNNESGNCALLGNISPVIILNLGFLSSLSWVFVIKGNIYYKKLWECHIDCLEDYVSGPIYKTMFYRDKQIYSFSNIIEVISWTMLLLWFALNLLYIHYHFEFVDSLKEIDCISTLSLIITCSISVVIVKGYCSGDISVKGGGCCMQETTVFIIRKNMSVLREKRD